MSVLTELINQLMNGIVIGLLYALIALGFMMIAGVMGVLNFSHGSLFAWGAYLAITLTPFIGFWLALIISPILVGFIGVILEFGVRRTYGKDPLYGLLLTFGAAMALEEVIRMIWGSIGRSMVIPAIVEGPLVLGPIAYSKYRVFLAGLAILLIIATWFFLEKTPYGSYIKAGTHDSEMVKALGVNIQTLRAVVFGIGSFLAGSAGIIAAPLWSIKPTMGVEAIMPAFVVVVVGGVGSFYGSIIGGLLVGVLTALAVMVMPAMSSLVMYVLMAVVLIVKPRGLMGEKSILEE